MRKTWSWWSWTEMGWSGRWKIWEAGEEGRRRREGGKRVGLTRRWRRYVWVVRGADRTQRLPLPPPGWARDHPRSGGPGCRTRSVRRR